jgi:D-glycero-D-manno-heptose 1,7-bisphosphate phosphatase
MNSSSARTKFVFLDRDGVINRKLPENSYVRHSGELVLLPGSAEAIAILNSRGIKVIVVTNQRGIALGLLTEPVLLEIHDSLQERLQVYGGHIDAFYHCPHNHDECSCRKPKTGLLEEAFVDFPEANSSNSVLIGDSLSDIEAGRKLGIATIFVNGEPGTNKSGNSIAAELASATSSSLLEAVNRIVLCEE